jgi:transcriptional regulator with XRE-family HTH domain
VANRPLSDFDRAASAWIRAAAAAQKLGQYELAERAGIHINTFRPYWRGERRIALGDFELIVNALGVDPEDAMKEIKSIRLSGNYSS